MQDNEVVKGARYVGVTSDGEIQIFGVKDRQATDMYEGFDFDLYKRNPNHNCVTRKYINRTIYYSISIDENNLETQKIAIEEYPRLEKPILLLLGEKRTILVNALEMYNAPIAFKFLGNSIPDPIWEEYEVNCELVQLYKINELLEVSEYEFRKAYTKEDCLNAIETAKERYGKEKHILRYRPLYSRRVDFNSLLKESEDKCRKS